MELKVWMDGIQRVVSGANYDTTCRDVVLALAHAMGRTGRFTLVEKWRESERPLTPAECPLLSLHKWGEYASEVKFYLIQAESDKVIGRKKGNLKEAKLDEWINKIPKGNHSTNTLAYDSLKRSLTFSGVNTIPCPPMSSSNGSDVSSNHNRMDHGYHDMMTNNSSSANSSRATVKPLPNGDIRITKDYRHSHAVQTSLKDIDRLDSPKLSPVSMHVLNRGDGKDVHPFAKSSSLAQTGRGDAREIHPANMPGSVSPYDQNHSAPHQKALSQIPSHQRVSPNQFLASSQLQNPSYVQSSWKQNTGVNISSSSSAPTPANRMLHQPPSLSQPSSLDSHPPPLHLPLSKPQSSLSFHTQPQKEPSSSQPLPKSSSLQYSNHNSRQQTKQRPLPAPRHTQNPTAQFEYPNTQGRNVQAPLPRQRSRERNESKEAQPPALQKNNDEQTKPLSIHNKWPPLEDSFYSNEDNDSKFPKPTTVRYAPNRRYRDEIKDISNSNNNSKTLSNVKAVENASSPQNSTGYAYKSSTLERSVPHQKKSLPTPARSLSTGETDDSKPGSDHLPLPAVQPRSGSEGAKLNFVDSALMKHTKTSIDPSRSPGVMSSFASAVAHVRQQSADGILKPKVNFHVRQSSSDGGPSENMLQEGIKSNEATNLASNSHNQQSALHRSSNDSTNASLEGHSKQATSQHSITSTSPSSPPPAFSPINFRPTSAFKEVSQRNNRVQSPSKVPNSYSLNQPSFSTFGIGVPPAHPPSGGNHSRQSSVEIEEYDLDQNFKDVLLRDTAGTTSLGKNLDIPMEYSLDSGKVTPVKTETEYLQLVRLIKVQQEKLQTQEAKIKDTDMEISSLESNESQYQLSRENISEQVSILEKEELENQQDLMELEKVDWVQIIDGEKKQDSSYKMQLVKLKKEIEELDVKLKKTRDEEEKLKKELQSEQQSVENKKKMSDEGEKLASLELSKLKEDISLVNKTIQEKEHQQKQVEDSIRNVEENKLEKEKKVEALLREWVDDSAEDEDEEQMQVLTDSVSEENHTEATLASKSPKLSASDNGEVILKILEGRLSPHPGLEGLVSEGLKSALKSPMTTKNPNGVWV
ncbi:mediator of RNA polymerase II transcription subunit 26 [Biomphalaria glabrata]|nr:mediator of RNA polymerase II transcription subunit 26 [Biomphalaria glabrata]